MAFTAFLCSFFDIYVSSGDILTPNAFVALPLHYFRFLLSHVKTTFLVYRLCEINSIAICNFTYENVD